MPAALPSEHPVVTFTRELDALLTKYQTAIDPADVSVALALALMPLCAAFADPAAVAALDAYSLLGMKKKMAKATLES